MGCWMHLLEIVTEANNLHLTEVGETFSVYLTGAKILL